VILSISLSANASASANLSDNALERKRIEIEPLQ
jgi:hypothetical protein